MIASGPTSMADAQATRSTCTLITSLIYAAPPTPMLTNHDTKQPQSKGLSPTPSSHPLWSLSYGHSPLCSTRDPCPAYCIPGLCKSSFSSYSSLSQSNPHPLHHPHHFHPLLAAAVVAAVVVVAAAELASTSPKTSIHPIHKLTTKPSPEAKQTIVLLTWWWCMWA